MANTPDRWQRPFADLPLSDQDTLIALGVPDLAALNESDFPVTETLQEIIKHDARIRQFNDRDVVVLAGDYGHSVFFILSGEVSIVLNPSSPFQRSSHRHRGLWKALKQLLNPMKGREQRDQQQLSSNSLPIRTRKNGSAQLIIETTHPWLENKHIVTLGQGEMFGEIAALLRSPRTATVIANGPLSVLEMRWQGFRDIRRYAPQFRASIDEIYRARSLKNQLMSFPLFKHLDEETLEKLVAGTLYESYGRMEWYSRFKKDQLQESIQSEPIIVEEGNYHNGLVIVCTGFARISLKQDSGRRTIDYLSSNEYFGWDELVEHWKTGSELVSRYTLSTIGYTDILVVPSKLVLETVIPTLSDRALQQSQRIHPGSNENMDQALLDFIVDKRIINGSSAMFINTERCIGCDDCVKACATSHNNNPRFVRQGDTSGHWAAINACMHCIDPVCLIGCPTGAIQRSEDFGEVYIHEAACIGCSSCANACPYENIRMIDIFDAKGEPILNELGEQQRKASKCDLCIDSLTGPACQNACPHDALTRIDLRDRQSVLKMGS